MDCYYYYMCLAYYGASEAVNLSSRYVEKSTKYSEQKRASYLEYKISCSLPVVCASSFQPSQHDIYRWKLIKVNFERPL